MDNIKEMGFVNRPPILDGKNYDYWNDHMVVFLKFKNNKTWKVVINGLTPPTIKVANGFESMKPEN